MIVALFALAAAMVIGGCAAVIQGFPYVRLESGLAMVIAGSVAASSGAVLFGLGVVAAGLRRVERAADRIPVPGAPGAVPAAAPDDRPRLPPVLPPIVPPASPSALPPAEPFLTVPERPRIEPTLGVPDGVRPAVARIEPAGPEAEPELPIPGLAPPPAPGPAAEPEAAPEPVRGASPEDDLFAGPGGPIPEAQADEPPALRPSLDAAPDPVPAPEPIEVARTVVGRYASGGNTYVMFEDGSIEAETPRGRFTFASLDELKAFVDAGGESSARGAA